jgi:hypothetical protein
MFSVFESMRIRHKCSFSDQSMHNQHVYLFNSSFTGFGGLFQLRELCADI